MRRLLLLLLLLILPCRAGEVIHYQAGKDTVSAYLATPKGKGPYPAIVMIHEWWGLNDWVKQNAERFAGQGYVVLCVDLYRGQVATDADLAHELSRGLPQDRALTDLSGAVAYLKGRPDVNKAKIGTIGWCMGGGYALDLSLKVPVQATVMCYGHTAEDVSGLKGPLLGLFGEKDRGINPETVKKFDQALTAAGKQHKVIDYPGVGHAFMNPNNKAGYDKVTAEKAWKEIDAFFAHNLKS